ncbi:MAG TPA: metal ABC transporter substrate-binding protein [Acholeplasmataceae bacterium]|nr:metal ABC transporter substrate-binding protein [Acholeplasmataceae bacterium]
MKKFAAVLLLVITLLGLASCTSSKKADIVTTMFPQYDFARQIVGDKMTVSLLVPPGVEVHAYEATSKDMVAIKESKLFIFTSLEIDQWVKDPQTIGGKDTVVMNLSEHVTDVPHDEDHIHTSLLSTEDEHDHSAELHYWVDPVIAIALIDAILHEIVEIDPANEAFYEANAHAYQELLHDAHEELDAFIQNGYVDASIYFAGHNALGMFAERYHINIVSLFEGFKPDADLTSSELISFTEVVKSSSVHTLFIEELAEPKAALQIKNELAKENYSLTLLELHAYHNVTKEQMEDGIRYIDLFRQNIDSIKSVLTQNI